MKKIAPYIVLLLMVASILIPVGIGYAQTDLALEVVAGEYNLSGFSFRASPAKSVYEGNGTYDFWFTITNLEESGVFDINGSQYELDSGITKCYKRLDLTGQTERFVITKVAEGNQTGISFQGMLTLKVVPKPIQEGGEER